VERPGIAEEAPALVATGISKSFGGTQALDGVGLTVLTGEVHGLVGENGSGKSTLIKILAGYHAPDPGGELEVGGRAVTLPLRPGEPRRLGLSFVHQDLGLIPSLSVLENLRLGELASARGLRISWKKLRRGARDTLARYRVELDVRARVAELGPVERALVAILRAAEEMPSRGGVLVLDEPTAFLPRRETDRLIALVREIAASGASVLFVSHDLDEVRTISHRVTVLRDGRSLGTRATAEVAGEELVELVVGRKLGGWRPDRGRLSDAAAVTVAGLAGVSVSGVSFGLRHGEVLGLTGLVGAGFAEVLALLCGAGSGAAGRLVLDGATLELSTMTSAAALRAGVVLLPGDRHRDGAVASLSVADNVTLPRLERYTERGVLRRSRQLEEAAVLLGQFDVRPRDPRLPYGVLSGGNQQKALVGKWLRTEPRLLLLDEPTRGVDVGARRQIFELIRATAEAGTAVVCASTDHEQLTSICDRVLVFASGRIVEEVAGAGLTAERLAEACYVGGRP
jgi:ribose transport system ATP-binding protein